MGIKLRVKATKEFKFYRNQVLGLSKKDFRALQAGQSVEIEEKLINKYPELFIKDEKKVVKNGS